MHLVYPDLDFQSVITDLEITNNNIVSRVVAPENREPIDSLLSLSDTECADYTGKIYNITVSDDLYSLNTVFDHKDLQERVIRRRCQNSWDRTQFILYNTGVLVYLVGNEEIILTNVGSSQKCFPEHLITFDVLHESDYYSRDRKAISRVYGVGESGMLYQLVITKTNDRSEVVHIKKYSCPGSIIDHVIYDDHHHVCLDNEGNLWFFFVNTNLAIIKMI